MKIFKRCALAWCLTPFLFGCFEKMEMGLTINPETALIEKIVIDYGAESGGPKAVLGERLKKINKYTDVGKKKTRISFMEINESDFVEIDEFDGIIFGIGMLAPYYTSEEVRAAYEKESGEKLPDSFFLTLRPAVLKKNVKSADLQMNNARYAFKKGKDGVWTLNIVSVLKNKDLQRYFKEISDRFNGPLSGKGYDGFTPFRVYLNIHYGNPGLFSRIASFFSKKNNQETGE